VGEIEYENEYGYEDKNGCGGKMYGRREFLKFSAAGVAGALAGDGRAAATPRPNVLWLMTDEQRTDSLGCYGSPWAVSPHLDALAKEGTVFRRAVTPAPVCAPARASLLTGRYPHETGIWHNIPPARYPRLEHLTALFHASGYASASFGKRHYSSTNDAFETEAHYEITDAVDFFQYKPPYQGEDYGIIQYPAAPFAWILGGEFPLTAEDTQEARAVGDAMGWLEGHDPARPFLLRVSFNAPHTPVVPPAPFDTLIDPDSVQYPAESERAPEHEPIWVRDWLRSTSDAGRLTRAQYRQARGYYYGYVAHMDAQVGRLLAWMRGRGLLENTIVCFVSDHGTHIGDYGLVQKQSFYEPVVNVPFFLWRPGMVAQGKMVETPVEIRSLLPTLLELCHIDVPRRNRAGSLAQALRAGVEPEARPVFSAFTLGTLRLHPDTRLVMVRDGDWKLSLRMDPAPGDGALYDLGNDPHERRNLYEDAGFAGTRDRLTRLILAHLDKRD
jgi:arylsulfatase